MSYQHIPSHIPASEKGILSQELGLSGGNILSRNSVMGLVDVQV